LMPMASARRMSEAGSVAVILWSFVELGFGVDFSVFFGPVEFGGSGVVEEDVGVVDLVVGEDAGGEGPDAAVGCGLVPGFDGI